MRPRRPGDAGFALLQCTRIALVAGSLASTPHLVLLLTPIYGLDDALFAVGALMAASSLSSLGVGLLVDRFGFQTVLGVGCALSVGCWLGLICATAAGAPYLVALACCVVQGMAVCAHITALQAGVSRLLPANRWQWGYTRSELARALGAVLGPLLSFPLAYQRDLLGVFVMAAIAYLTGLAFASGLWALLRQASLRRDSPHGDTLQSQTRDETARPGWSRAQGAGVVVLVLIGYVAIAQHSLVAPVYFDAMGFAAGVNVILVLRCVGSACALAVCSIGRRRSVAAPNDHARRQVVRATLVMWGSFAAAGLLPPQAALFGFALAGIAFDVWLAPSVGLLAAQTAERWAVRRTGMVFSLLMLVSGAGAVLSAWMGGVYGSASAAGGPATYWVWIAALLAIPLCGATAAATLPQGRRPPRKWNSPAERV